MIKRLVLCFILIVSVVQVEAATYHISPTGSDSNDGTLSLPWKTFSFVIPQLDPGDTLILLDGTYNAGNSGLPNINCASTANNGLLGSPITIRAENQRQAFIEGNGNVSTLDITSCSYWIIDGLRINNTNLEGGASGQVIQVTTSTNLIFRNILAHNNNHYLNTHVMLFKVGSDSNLIEDSEFYNFHRHGILFDHSDNNEIRRVYCHSRSTADVAGGFPSIFSDRGDYCLGNYPSSNNITQNLISEGNGGAWFVQAPDTANNNKCLGCISNEDLHSFRPALDYGARPLNNQVIHSVAIGGPAGFFGGDVVGGEGPLFQNMTFLGKGIGFRTQNNSIGGSPPFTFTVKNTLAVNIGAQAFWVDDTQYTSWLIDYANVHNSGTAFVPAATDARITNESLIDPQLGTCKVWLPDTSPMKGAGEGGADIGATILYRYEGGTLTSEPLWNPSTGAFPCGVQIEGVNDIAGSSCFDVHERLNVNTNGCSFPSGFGESSSVITDKSSYTIDETITVTVDNGLGGLQEWFGVWLFDAVDADLTFDDNFKYVGTCTTTAPVTPPTYPKQCTFNAHMAGTYNVRYFRENGITNKLAQSADFTVVEEPVGGGVLERIFILIRRWRR